MNREELTYLAVLLGSIPVGFVLKERGPRWRQLGGAAVGAGLALLTCGAHLLHSLGTVLGTWAILSLLPRHSGGASLVWAFGYLLFFRTFWVWGLPEPPPYANALQLLITLKMVSMASDVQELREAELKGVTSEETRLLIGSLRRVPSLIDILCYSYCYLGLLTGPFYRLGTYLDWVWGPPGPPALRRVLLHARWAPALALLGAAVGRAWPAQVALSPEFGARPWLARVAIMVPVFLALRLRLYVGWLCAEGGCVAAGLGAYPESARAKPGQGPTVRWERPKECAQVPQEQWDFQTIRTVDPWGTEVGRRFRGGLRRWNMTVQWWLAAYVHRRGPRQYPLLRNAWTMLASAYWHGLHGGQYLSFLTVPLWLAAEAAAEAELQHRFGVPLERLGGWKGSALRAAQWFLKMRAFEYLSMGFVLRGAAATLRFWASVHFCLHLAPLLILLLAAAAARGREKGREKGGEKGNEGEGDGGGGEGDAQGRRRRRAGEGEEREVYEGWGEQSPKIGEGGDPNPKICEGGDLLNPKIREGGDSKICEGGDSKVWEGGDLLNPKIREGGDSKIYEGGDLLNPKIREGGDPDPKICEGGDSKICEGGDPKVYEGGDPLNPKVWEGGDPNPKIREGGDPNPKNCEGGDLLNPKIREGGDPKIHKGGDLKIYEGWDALNPKIPEGGDPNPKICEGGDPLNPKIPEGGDVPNPKIREGWGPPESENL